MTWKRKISCHSQLTTYPFLSCGAHRWKFQMLLHHHACLIHCEERVWQQSQDGARDCSQVLWLPPDFLIHLKISCIHRENCTGAPRSKIGPYDKWWFWPMDCCYVDWADGAWLREYIRDCDWGRVVVVFSWRDWFLERDSCMMLKDSWINCFEKNVVLSLFSAGQNRRWHFTLDQDTWE